MPRSSRASTTCIGPGTAVFRSILTSGIEHAHLAEIAETHLALRRGDGFRAEAAENAENANAGSGGTPLLRAEGGAPPLAASAASAPSAIPARDLSLRSAREMRVSGLPTAATLAAPVALAALLVIPQRALQRLEAVEPHMGTLVRITVYTATADDARAAFRAGFDRIRDLDNTLSDYKPD